MQISSIILGITGGAIGLIASLYFLIAGTQIPALVLLILFLSITSILTVALNKNNPAIAGILMLIIGIGFASMRWVIPPIILAAPFFIISGILSLIYSKQKINSHAQYKINYFLKTFISVIINLLFFEAISSAISYFSIDDDWKFYWYLSVPIFGIVIVIYSALYTLLCKIHKFSLKYSIIYNSILGVLLIINTILSYKIKIGWGYQLFLLFIILQIFITSAYKYKKIP
jgi:hypothetical protein